MSLALSPLIFAEELAMLVSNPELVVVHAGGEEEAYKNKHIADARYLNLDRDLSDIKADAANGGRHPLPAIEEFGKTLAKAGITPESHVVTYDEKAGANAAARFWWMMRSIGHEKIQVLNGGLQAAEGADIPINSGIVKVNIVEDYPVKDWHWPMAGMDEVESAASDPNRVVIDVRDAYRYRGDSEPIDPAAGHIPGAINIPLSENLSQTGMFLPTEELLGKYSAKAKGRETIIHCGSGVTACHTILAFASAGLNIPKLYVGSWSEWCRNGKAIEMEKN